MQKWFEKENNTDIWVYNGLVSCASTLRALTALCIWKHTGSALLYTLCLRRPDDNDYFPFNVNSTDVNAGPASLELPNVSVSSDTNIPSQNTQPITVSKYKCVAKPSVKPTRPSIVLPPNERSETNSSTAQYT